MRNNDNSEVEIMRGIVKNTVNKLEPLYGSRMVAYEKVAAVVGVSASWVRKFITVDGTPEPRWSVGYRLAKYYKALCDDLDRKAERERSKINEIVGGLNEIDPLIREISLPAFLPDRPRGDLQS